MRQFLILLLLLAAACSTPASRIKKNRAAYESWPPGVQALVKEGKADVGFTPEQARTALGKPDRVYTRKSVGGVQEVWAYGGRGARTGVGLGLGIGGGAASYGLGVGVGGPDGRDDERVRVVFESDRVISVESREK